MRSWLLPPPLVQNGSTIRACRIILSVNRYYNTTSGSPLPDLSLLTSEVLTPPSIKPLLSNTNDSIHLIAGQVKPEGQQTCPSTWSPTPVTSLANPSPLLWGHPPAFLVTIAIQGYHHYDPFSLYPPTLHPISRRESPSPPLTSSYVM